MHLVKREGRPMADFHKLRLFVLGTLLCGSASVRAHESWLVVDMDRAEKDTPFRFAFRTGEVFPTSESAAKPERVAEWNVVRRAKVEKLSGITVEDKDLVARKSFTHPGFYLIGIALTPSFIELSPKDFEQYLFEEKADAALASFKRRAAPDAPAREIYTKFAKTWVTVGTPGKDATVQQAVGHLLEIIPTSDPRTWVSGMEVEVKVTLEGQPIGGVYVSSGHEGLPAHTFAERLVTDANGLARFTIGNAGHWYFRTHLIRPLAVPRAATSAPDAPKADWESFWASVTFRVAR